MITPKIIFRVTVKAFQVDIIGKNQKSKAPSLSLQSVVSMDIHKIGEVNNNYFRSKKGKAFLLQPSHLKLSK